MTSLPFRADTNRRSKSNEFLSTPAGVLKYAGDKLDRAEATYPGQAAPREAAAREARGFIDRALRYDIFQKEPAIWLQRAVYVQMDSLLPLHEKQHAAERAARMLELSLEADFTGLDIHHHMHLGCMLGLAFSCEQDRPDLSLRFLDLIDRLDPDGDISAEGREQLRGRCTPVTIPVYIAPAHPLAISPSALAPSILKR